jgi:hypothetical protein
MSTKRMLIAWVVALVALNIYDFAVFAYALRDFHAQFPRWLKPDTELPMLKMFLTGAFNTAVVTVFYALFARAGAARLSTGIVFGCLLGLIAGWVPQASWKLLFVDYPFYPMWAAAIFGEYLLLGLVLGLVYKEQ